MGKADLGTKRVCPQCGARYYDMKKKPPVCPQCGAVFDPENLVKSRRGRSAEKKQEAPKPEEDLDNLTLEDGDDTLFEDADELADDDVDDVIEVEDDDDSR